MTIRQRLTLQFVGVTFLIVFAFSSIIYFLSYDFKNDLFYKRLEEKGQSTADLLFKVEGIDAAFLRVIDNFRLTQFDKEKVTIYDNERRMLFTSNDENLMPVDTGTFSSVIKNKKVRFISGEFQVAVVKFVAKKKIYFIVVSAVDTNGMEKMSNLLLILIVGIIIITIFSSVAGWVYAGRALSPLPIIVDEVNSITAHNLSTRLPEGQGKDEIEVLAKTFNQVLDRLQDAFELQKHFMSNASHELRTPLTVMKGHLEVSLLNPRSNEEYQALMRSLLEDLQRMIELVNGLLDLAESRFDVSQIEIKKLRFDEIIFNALSDVSRKYPHIPIDFEMGENIDSEESLTLRGSEQLLKTSVSNLIDNACKYGKGREVKVSLDEEKEHLIFSVTDKGHGIADLEQEFVFNPIFRSKNTKHIIGHGLGLALVKRIIELHHGEITLKSKLNEGSTFTVRLPKHAFLKY